MEYLLEIIVVIIGAVVAGILGWGVSKAKDYFDLDPDGQIMASLEIWEEHIADWVMSEAERRGADLTIPETRWEFVNEAVAWGLDKIPKLMDFLGYSKEDIAREVEALVKRRLEKL